MSAPAAPAAPADVPVIGAFELVPTDAAGTFRCCFPECANFDTTCPHVTKVRDEVRAFIAEFIADLDKGPIKNPDGHHTYRTCTHLDHVLSKALGDAREETLEAVEDGDIRLAYSFARELGHVILCYPFAKEAETPAKARTAVEDANADSSEHSVDLIEARAGDASHRLSIYKQQRFLVIGRTIAAYVTAHRARLDAMYAPFFDSWRTKIDKKLATIAALAASEVPVAPVPHVEIKRMLVPLINMAADAVNAVFQAKRKAGPYKDDVRDVDPVEPKRTKRKAADTRNDTILSAYAKDDSDNDAELDEESDAESETDYNSTFKRMCRHAPAPAV